MKKPDIEELRHRFGDLREDLIPILSDELGLGEISVNAALLCTGSIAQMPKIFKNGINTGWCK